MAGQRRLRILGALFGEGGTDNDVPTRRLCDVAVEITDVTGAGIMLMSGDLPRATVCSSNSVSRTIEELQYGLGEGPCVDAYNEALVVIEPDLVDPVMPRWPAFAGPAIEAGVRAVFAFPLQAGAVRLGALDLYRDRPGMLTDDQHAHALVMADVAGQVLVLMQANAPLDRLATELEAGADFHFVVHQAAGMIAAQIGVSVGQALVRLRAHAFAAGRPVADVAQAVVDRVLRFDDETKRSDGL